MAKDKKHGERNYFNMFIDLLEYAKQAIDYLEDALLNFDPSVEVMEAKLKEIHAIEHAADIAKHELMAKLVKEFITPIEREDIMAIAAALDEVTDTIEELYQKIYMYHIVEILPSGMEFVGIIKACVEKLQKVYNEFAHYKKSHVIYDDIVELNLLEEKGDELYIKVVRNIYQNVEDPVKAFAWTTIFNHMEKCCDTCESAGNLVEEVIMKNS